MGREPGEATAQAQTQPHEGERQERQAGGSVLTAVPVEKALQGHWESLSVRGVPRLSLPAMGLLANSDMR